MFTGIVSEVGEIRNIVATETGASLVIVAPQSAGSMQLGDSIAVNGVCLTAVALDGETVAVQAIPETLRRTNLGTLDVGASVDLERPMPANGRFDGHVVQGHVDGVGTLSSITADGDSKRLRFDVDASLARYIVEKGSITIDGVSLTVTAVSALADETQWFEVALIPHTLDVTVLGRRRIGDMVNLETDILAKYIERLMETGT